ncbi:LysR family transcriptional regulator [Mycobacterium montefiorense]|uniref:Probable hydrogen peroxide-inducible genes activator n=1 Tax=Mycobacterium montefiorense TaxID=154654 RepID=A0AA37US24_9MYCO|nr:LysR family transcriptional regulator [Mycobacterium montefiorense]GBG37984.1 LysR family transcriptional regulator [Mycobacterium montefiorense]GKU33867.1 LysR family transcriptional regulator [Mycobacterium montefiorense]GKU41354.1 LysR family transcriptional regulator [Mycobacterium montefiorense]GKU46264.1 LysR family transcriptional regulator [Mycobacterium montefiorense]GKU52421.1 LysR family transcriptional regulator [Mycobacterium montefiorense]
MAQVLDIAPLRSLVAVADCGGFHRAAAALHLSQSAVSQHLRKIESVLGEPVVQRCGRGVLFTEIGQRVLRHARTILAAHDAALDDLGATEQRVLTVGATEHGADVMLPALTSVLADRLPDRRPRFRLDRNVSLADAVDRGLVDLAIMLDGSGLDRANASGVVALQWVSARTCTIRRADPLPLVIYAEPCTLREPAFALLDKHGVDYEIVAECGDLAGLYAAVRSGLGLALLPKIGKLPDGLCPAEGLPAPSSASILVRGRSGLDPDLLSTVDAAVRDVLAADK